MPCKAYSLTTGLSGGPHPFELRCPLIIYSIFVFRRHDRAEDEATPRDAPARLLRVRAGAGGVSARRPGPRHHVPLAERAHLHVPLPGQLHGAPLRELGLARGAGPGVPHAEAEGPGGSGAPSRRGDKRPRPLEPRPARGAVADEYGTDDGDKA